MNWRLENACTLTWRSAGNPREDWVKIALIADMIPRFCIGLCLLKEGLIDALDLVVPKPTSVFRLRRSSGVRSSIELQPNKASLALDATSLEYWQDFTLRAVRDGVAEVSHLDLQPRLVDHPDQSFGVVLWFPHTGPPMSPEEARRRLGL